MPREIMISGRRVFELVDCQDSPLAPGEIRGPTVVTLVSQGTEIGWADGGIYPVRPGYAAIFCVEEIGSAVTGVRKGELRFAMGPHRSSQTHAVLDTLPVPNGLPPDIAVIARLMGVSMTTLMTTAARPGDRVIVTGAGPVGLLAAQLFRIGGYRVTVVDPDLLRRSQAAKAGLHDALAAMPLDDPDLAGRVALVVECSGHETAVVEGCRILRRLGEVVLIGVPWRKYTDKTAHELLNAVFFGLITVRSGWEWQLPLHSRGFIWEELHQGYNNAPHSSFSGYELALSWLAEGRIQLDGLVRVEAPDDPQALYTRIIDRTIEEPLIVLDWANKTPATRSGTSSNGPAAGLDGDLVREAR
ncbi:zinc-binding dehydrogenase [Rubellimicrobium roseum]|uniref:Zinc-binding dehydrogenase n=1 Tax=Rubellimicrobium roseum TaxID=687525 RepID=A0A5C4NDF9_9RHOB|nr:zinc-binding dehydrogenase [Rubellimicrobium roseum]TNC72761.1 zinc-binding dehydrogenase [Rubellimicrobium roseum]